MVFNSKSSSKAYSNATQASQERKQAGQQTRFNVDLTGNLGRTGVNIKETSYGIDGDELANIIYAVNADDSAVIEQQSMLVDAISGISQFASGAKTEFGEIVKKVVLLGFGVVAIWGLTKLK